MTRPHTTHYESCGCCEAERDALKAQVERMRDGLHWARTALKGHGATWDAGRVAEVLASTPAQSLAAHDAEVRAKALREALVECEEWFDQRADADAQGDPMRYVGNPEMAMLCRVSAALAASPAQSLAAHDAEVRAQALREASDACLAQAREWEKERCSQASSYVNAFRIASRAILALAERAPEVER